MTKKLEDLLNIAPDDIKEENQQKEETNKSGWFNFWPFK